MKVIKAVDVSLWSVSCICRECTSELEVSYGDIKAKLQQGDGPHAPSWLFTYICPICQTTGHIVHNAIPAAHRNLLMKAAYQ